MELSGLSNVSPAPKPSAGETSKYNDENSKQTAETTETKSSVSNESQTSQVPPPNPTSGAGNEPTPIPTAESNTGGQLNVSV